MPPEHEHKSTHKQYNEMFDAWSNGNHSFALELSREFVREYPDFNLGWLLQGIILYELARYNESEQVLHNAIQGIPLEQLHHAHLHLGHLYRDRGNYDTALTWYRKVIELNSGDAGHHIFLGALLAKMGNFSAAEAVHHKATQCPKGPIDEAYLNLGLVLRAQERYQDALVCFQKALEIDPDDKEALTAKVDVEKAIDYLTKVNP